MCLVNGAEGIGTGWSTQIPCFNPLEICDNLRRKLSGKDFYRMRPWYKGFNGRFEAKDETHTSYTIYGNYSVNGETLTITELPVGVWTRNYKNFLEELALKDTISDIKEFHKDNTVKFELQVPGLRKIKAEEIEKTFKLTASLSCNNFVLFDRDYKIQRYATEMDIMRDFFSYRL